MRLVLQVGTDKSRRARPVVSRVSVGAVCLVVTLAGCGGSDSPDATAQQPSSSPKTQQTFRVEAFTAIDDKPLPQALQAKLQDVLEARSQASGGGGIAATVMSPDGTWSGAAGLADGRRDVRVEDQFAIASITKSIIAAQVMLMAETGELELDAPATDYLADDLDFDTNGATIRHLLAQRSGIPTESWAEVDRRLLAEPGKPRPPSWLLSLVPDRRGPVGQTFEYANANYSLLGLVLEHVGQTGVAEVLRGGVLDIGGVERIIYQPAEAPSSPMAMPDGEPTTALGRGAGYLPSLAAASSHEGAANMASDAPSLARWWSALCAGDIVSSRSLTEMARLRDGYGLGMYNVADGYAEAVGHSGEHINGTYASWAGCLPDTGTVVVVLTNRAAVDVGAVARSIVTVALADHS